MKAQTRFLYLLLVVALLCAGPWVGAMARTAAAQAGPPTGTWVTEKIPNSSYANQANSRSLALDHYGQPHVAFGGEHLYYASYSAGRWQVEMIDPENYVGSYATLVLDSNDYPHIAYLDNTNRDIKYAAYDGNDWHIERIASDAWDDNVAALALGPNGRPQIAYYANATFMLAWYDGSTWQSAELDSILGGPSSSGTMVLDAGGNPHLAFYSDGLKYAYVRDNAWHVEMVDPNPYPESGHLPYWCGQIGLALDGQGLPHIAYCQPDAWSYYTLRYTHYDGQQWQIQVIESWDAYDISLVLDASGYPHLSFRDDRANLIYTYFSDSAWLREIVGVPTGIQPSLALDPAGRPHITYNSTDGSTNYAHIVPPTFADPAFEAVWQRTDRPIAEGAVARSWMWGPRPLTGAAFEPYADAPGGSRLVQYFDKSRAEINDPNGDRSSQWFVTNGLLVHEMVSGWMQLGDDQFEWRGPAGEAVGGDPVAGNPNCPLYASFAGLIDVPAGDRTGQAVTATLARDGTVGDDPTKAGYPGTTIAYYAQATGHNVPQALWTFMNQRGPIYTGGHYKDGLVVDWLFAMGYPISEPYWTRCTVAGQEKDVLVQLFERRVLTYTPSNPAGWQVEMGNVGRHYYTWRYGIEP